MVAGAAMRLERGRESCPLVRLSTLDRWESDNIFVPEHGGYMGGSVQVRALESDARNVLVDRGHRGKRYGREANGKVEEGRERAKVA